MDMDGGSYTSISMKYGDLFEGWLKNFSLISFQLWPLVGCFAFLGFFMSYVIWWQFQKTEVQ